MTCQARRFLFCHSASLLQYHVHCRPCTKMNETTQREGKQNNNCKSRECLSEFVEDQPPLPLHQESTMILHIHQQEEGSISSKNRRKASIPFHNYGHRGCPDHRSRAPANSLGRTQMLDCQLLGTVSPWLILCTVSGLPSRKQN